MSKKVGNKYEYAPPTEILFAPPAPIVEHTYYTPPNNYNYNSGGYGSMASIPHFAKYLNLNSSNSSNNSNSNISHKFRKSVKKTRKSSKKSSRKIRKSSKKSSRKSSLKKKCQQWVSNKIAINMKEYKAGKFKSPKQAIAVAYSQVIKKHPECKRVLKRKSK